MNMIFSVNEIITASGGKLSIHTIKDYCRRGELHPCIYFEGNIVCIHDKRHQNGIDVYDSVTHTRSVSWSKKFKGYIYASIFINYTGHTNNNLSDVFYNFEKIMECIPPNTEIPLIKEDEYLKAFPPMVDDDIQEKRWLREAQTFQGNAFTVGDIVFLSKELITVFPEFFKDTKNSRIESEDEDSIKELKNRLQQAQDKIKELEEGNTDRSDIQKLSNINSRLLTLIGAMLHENSARGLRNINQAGIASEIANMRIPNLGKRNVDDIFSAANKKFNQNKTNT